MAVKEIASVGSNVWAGLVFDPEERGLLGGVRVEKSLLRFHGGRHGLYFGFQELQWLVID